MLAAFCLLASLVLWPVAEATGWVKSVRFVNELSLLAIVLCCVVWVVTAHLDVQREEEDVASEVVDKLRHNG
jgi:Ca2+/Na+ antiporter